MFRNLICVAVVAAFSLSLALAQNTATQVGKDQAVWAKIVKVDGNKVVVREYDPKTKEFGKERELNTSPTLKVFQFGKDGKSSPVAAGLKGEPFTNLGTAGAYARINMQGTNASEIHLYNDAASWQKAMTSGAAGGA